MALKVKAQEKLQKIGTYAGKYRYIMMPELYTSLSQEKVIKRKAFLGTDSWTSQAAARPLVAFMRGLHALLAAARYRYAAQVSPSHYSNCH